MIHLQYFLYDKISLAVMIFAVIACMAAGISMFIILNKNKKEQ
jgi:hypothetical protein